jgi:erythromycin esterase-like protein
LLLPVPTSAEEPLPRGVYSLRSTVPSSGFEDLQALDALFEGARIVAVGEGTHGTREFVSMRWRLMEYLAEHHGFRLFLLEEDLIGAEKLNQYVVDGLGDPYDLVVKLNDWGQEWGKRVREQVELLLWAREFNRGRRDPVHFLGFDAKRLDRAMSAVVSCVLPNGGTLATEIERRYAQYRDLDEGNIARRPANVSVEIPFPEGDSELVKLSGWIRTDQIERGWAGLLLRIEGEDKHALSTDMLDHGAPSSSTPWTRFEIEARAPEETVRLVAGGFSVGTGTACFDEVELSVNGEAIGTEEGGLGFASLDNLRQYAPSHDVSLGVGRDGSSDKSVCLKYRPSLIDEALADARNIASHLHELPASPDQTERMARCTQYATMVVQALTFRDMHAARDRAMAENVRWWLDQFPPGTKAVLAAANAHVARMGTRLGKVGDYLTRWYGDEYHAIAMTTYSGTYLAEGEAGPGVHVLPDAPADSIEGLLHEFHLPVLVVDLRHVARDSPLSSSLESPIKLRGAGLTHRENQFADVELPKLFDVLLSIDTTSHTSLLAAPPEEAADNRRPSLE